MTTFLSICDLTKEVSTSFKELPDFCWLLLNSVQKVKKVLAEISKGYGRFIGPVWTITEVARLALEACSKVKTFGRSESKVTPLQEKHNCTKIFKQTV
jgi:hypothetical protein